MLGDSRRDALDSVIQVVKGKGEMALTLNVDVRGVQRKFGLLISSWKDLSSVLREFDKEKRAEVKELFASEGGGKWPPLKSDTLADRRQVATRRMEGKLRRELKRAERRFAYRKARFEGKEQALAAFGAIGKRRQKAPSNSAVLRRLATLAEFRRILRGGSAEGALLETKPREKLIQRMARAEAKAGKGRILGRVAQSFQSRIEGARWVMESEIPWAGAHNEGGEVGRGAKLPERRFLEITEADVERLRAKLIMRGLLAWEAA